MNHIDYAHASGWLIRSVLIPGQFNEDASPKMGYYLVTPQDIPFSEGRPYPLGVKFIGGVIGTEVTIDLRETPEQAWADLPERLEDLVYHTYAY